MAGMGPFHERIVITGAVGRRIRIVGFEYAQARLTGNKSRT